MPDVPWFGLANAKLVGEPTRLGRARLGRYRRDRAEHALAACRLADRREVQAVEATSLHTLVRMVDNGLGITLLPQRSCQASFAAAAAYLV